MSHAGVEPVALDSSGVRVRRGSFGKRAVDDPGPLVADVIAVPAGRVEDARAENEVAAGSEQGARRPQHAPTVGVGEDVVQAEAVDDEVVAPPRRRQARDVRHLEAHVDTDLRREPLGELDRRGRAVDRVDAESALGEVAGARTGASAVLERRRTGGQLEPPQQLVEEIARVGPLERPPAEVSRPLGVRERAKASVDARTSVSPFRLRTVNRGVGHGSMLGDRPLLFSAYPLGYGPAAKAMAVAARCASAGVESVFVGDGVAHELVVRSDRIFAWIVEAPPGGAAARALVRDSGAVVSVMERDIARVAVEESRPLHVVDSLLFMRDRVPDAFVPANRYWAQRFPGVEPPPDRSVRPMVVGPILSDGPAPESGRTGGLVVNLGGFEDNGDRRSDRRYLRLVLRALETVDGRVRTLASKGTAAEVGRLAAPRGIESLAHDDALRVLASADVVVTAPGLTATLECFRLGRPVFFLPPRNYSQWCILKTLRSYGVAPTSLHWEDLDDRLSIAGRLPESVRNPRVRAAIDQLAPSRAAAGALAGVFEAAVDGDHAGLRADQQAFLRSLGTDGAHTIADDLVASGG